MIKNLSKSNYMAGIDCSRRLWLNLWRKELKPAPAGMSKLIMGQGRDFGELAHQLYPGAVLIDIDIRNLAKAEDDTRSAIDEGASLVLEATFRYGQYRVLSDVVERLPDGSWHLIEVKSSTRTKPEHIPDLAYQRFVMEGCGYRVSRCSVVYANTFGTAPPVADLFSMEDVTEVVAGHLPVVAPSLIPLTLLLDEQAECPPVAFTKLCTKCDFQSHCWEGIERPTIYEVIDVRKIPELEAEGIFYVDDIPADFKLSAKVRNTVERMQARRVDIDKPAIQGMLDRLAYPLYFLDFESAAIATPLLEESSPWQKYAFQYSLHVQDESGHVEHIEFLHEDCSDPSRAIADSLVKNIGDTGSIIVYYQPMEKGVLKDLAKQFPDRCDALKGMITRLWDLEVVFNKHYRHWQWGTRSSIKKVLPTLVPELSYKDLEIQEGGSATAEWIEMIRATDAQHKAKIAQALLEYCKLDTWAMVELLAVLKSGK